MSSYLSSSKCLPVSSPYVADHLQKKRVIPLSNVYKFEGGLRGSHRKRICLLSEVFFYPDLSNLKACFAFSLSVLFSPFRLYIKPKTTSSGHLRNERTSLFCFIPLFVVNSSALSRCQ